MAHSDKISVVILGNGKSLKKALITNILGRDLSTLSRRNVLRRTQTYEDDVYKFTCTPDLDKDCEDIREVFYQRPDMCLLVVEEGFDSRDVWRQIEHLHFKTGKPTEDFVVVLPLTCKSTDLPFRWSSVEQLISKLRKKPADGQQLPTNKRPADPLMDTTVTLVLLGMAGTGKSASGNTILREQRFLSTSSSMPVTKKLQVVSMGINNTHVRLIDTPDMFDDAMELSVRKKHVDECRQLCEPGPCVYLLVMHVSRHTDGEREILKKLERAFGSKVIKQTVILFTRGGDLQNSNMSLQDFLANCQPNLRKIVEKCGNRCVLFENRSSSSQQVEELMQIVFRLVENLQKY